MKKSTRIKKALKLCAKAHNCDYQDFGDEIALSSTSIPTLNDAQMIAQAFFGTSNVVSIEYSLGFIVIALYEPFIEKIDEAMLAIALPYGTTI